MCLEIDQSRKAPKKPITVYKVYYRYGKSFLQSKVVRSRFLYSEGREIRSDRASSKVTEMHSIIKGFHVYCCKRDALGAMADSWGGVLVELTGKPEHFVSFGRNPGSALYEVKGAVFTKLTFGRILKEKKDGQVIFDLTKKKKAAKFNKTNKTK